MDKASIMVELNKAKNICRKISFLKVESSPNYKIIETADNNFEKSDTTNKETHFEVLKYSQSNSQDFKFKHSNNHDNESSYFENDNLKHNF